MINYCVERVIYD